MLGIFKNKRKEIEAEARKEEKEMLDGLVDELVDAIFDAGHIGTVAEFKIAYTEKGLQVDAGGSKIAAEAFCELGEGYKIIYDTVVEQLTKLGMFVSDSIESISGAQTEWHVKPEEKCGCGCGKCDCDGNDM